MNDRPRCSPRRRACLLPALAALCVAPFGDGAARAEACGVEGTRITIDEGRARTTLDVLTYNIEGLGWPARTGRAPKLAEIGDRLAALRKAGQAPDLVLFQETFTSAARNGVRAAGYPYQVAGPSSRARRELPAGGAVEGRRKPRRGEFRFALSSGGLVIASRFPIVEQKAEPYSRRSCAGFDCLSNKGALFARILVPGAPEPINVFNTHMNSRGASRAPAPKTLSAHEIQARELAAFIAAAGSPGDPIILGGDFNMRRSEERFSNFKPLLPLTLARQYCQAPGTGCDIRISFDGDAPWMDTQDLQLFNSGGQVKVRPIRLEAMFDGSPDSPALSDHDGYRVVYELSWPASETSRAACGAAAP